EVIGVIKAYCTRVGGGPFPTELNDETGERMRREGHEFGATTGRPRRCGWLDLVAVNYTIMISGVTKLVITKADVLNDFDDIKVCSSYQADDHSSTIIPFEINTSDIQPAYDLLPGWRTDHSMKSANELPPTLKAFIKHVEARTSTPVTMISIGAGRDQLVKI
ncbi:MAG: adenylosuccinate synthetase, partial [Chitinophagales bacterium]